MLSWYEIVCILLSCGQSYDVMYVGLYVCSKLTLKLAQEIKWNYVFISLKKVNSIPRVLYKFSLSIYSPHLSLFSNKNLPCVSYVER